jgi:tetratricopeptide (TPR) repeat protein
MNKGAILCGIAGLSVAVALLAVTPQHVCAQAQEGVDLFKSGQYRDAETALRQELKADPSNVRARYYLGLSLLEQEKNQEAFAELKKVQQDQLRADQWTRSPVPNEYQVQIALGRVRLALKDYAEALRNIESARIEDGNSAEIYLYRGMYYLEQKKNAEAAKDLERVIKLAPDSPEAARAKQLMSSK